MLEAYLFMTKSRKPRKTQIRKPKRKVGRPTKYDSIDLKLVTRVASLNLTDKQIAKALNISEATLNNYKELYPEFLESLKKGKALVDDKVVASLFQRAVGYSHPDVHISNYKGQIKH